MEGLKMRGRIINIRDALRVISLEDKVNSRIVSRYYPIA